jgi:hypothetical protein
LSKLCAKERYRTGREQGAASKGQRSKRVCMYANIHTHTHMHINIHTYKHIYIHRREKRDTEAGLVGRQAEEGHSAQGSGLRV